MQNFAFIEGFLGSPGDVQMLLVSAALRF